MASPEGEFTNGRRFDWRREPRTSGRRHPGYVARQEEPDLCIGIALQVKKRRSPFEYDLKRLAASFTIAAGTGHLARTAVPPFFFFFFLFFNINNII